MKIKRTDGGWTHHCPGCNTTHRLPDGWAFDGNAAAPTFTPSFRHTWGGESSGRVCHYNVAAGRLHYCTDCTHALAGKVVDLPELSDA